MRPRAPRPGLRMGADLTDASARRSDTPTRAEMCPNSDSRRCRNLLRRAVEKTTATIWLRVERERVPPPGNRSGPSQGVSKWVILHSSRARRAWNPTSSHTLRTEAPPGAVVRSSAARQYGQSGFPGRSSGTDPGGREDRSQRRPAGKAGSRLGRCGMAWAEEWAHVRHRGPRRPILISWAIWTTAGSSDTEPGGRQGHGQDGQQLRLAVVGLPHQDAEGVSGRAKPATAGQVWRGR